MEFNNDIYIAANYEVDDNGNKVHWMVYWCKIDKFNLGCWRSTRIPDNQEECKSKLKEIADPNGIDYGKGIEFIKYGVRDENKYKDESIESLPGTNPMGEYAIKFIF